MVYVKTVELHHTTKFRGGSGHKFKTTFSYVKFAADYEYDIHFSVISQTREIIKGSEIPDFGHSGVPSELSSWHNFLDSALFTHKIH